LLWVLLCLVDRPPLCLLFSLGSPFWCYQLIVPKIRAGQHQNGDPKENSKGVHVGGMRRIFLAMGFVVSCGPPSKGEAELDVHVGGMRRIFLAMGFVVSHPKG